MLPYFLILFAQFTYFFLGFRNYELVSNPRLNSFLYRGGLFAFPFDAALSLLTLAYFLLIGADVFLLQSFLNHAPRRKNFQQKIVS